ncbi:uncharacterized protein [Primulina huaijiensis]|uniref:uncharacterized protein n=1 Tax=Primulina huaijiensis TaxID=1492673 RepID=UPI003CC6F6D3
MDTSLANAALRPPILDGTNYSLWKVKIRYYIKSIDEQAWQCVINGWTSPSVIDQDGDSLPKPETDWTADEVQNSNYNSKALNAIFTSVDINMFSLITNCTSAKSAWDILQRHCEGSESVRRTRLRMLTSKFEMMRMEESENILDYDCRLRKIANEAFSLGDPISNERLVSKVLRSLPERFNIKICAIDEAKDTSQMALEDLIRSLRTFEMNTDMQKKDKGKTIAFQVSNDTYDDLLQISQEVNESDLCEDSISFITKKFGDYLKRIIDKKKDAQPSKFPSLPAPERPQRFPAKQQFQPKNEGKGQYNSKRYDSVQCRECKGFGHYANECANRLRKNKGYNVSLSDEESDEAEKSNDEDNHTSLTALLTEKHCLQVNPLGVALGVATPGRNICKKPVYLKSATFENPNADDDLEADDEEITLESVQKLYEELFEDWTKRNKLNSSLIKENTDLKAVVAKLEVILSKKDLELGKTKEELQKTTETLSKFNTSTSKLESILLMGRDDKNGLGFKDSVFEIGESSKSHVFVKGKTETFTPPQTTSSTKSSSPKRQHATHTPNKRKRRSLVLDSGSSRHMTGSREYLIDYIDQKGGRVTYGGRAKGKIVGKGTLNVERLPMLHNVLHVEGLNSNLISISQLCDHNLLVKFDKHNCEVFNEANKCIMTGTRTSDNCYQIGEELSCKHVQITELDLWHQKLGHANFKTLKNLSKYDAVRGMPNLSSGIPYVCGDCQKGKQTRVSHPVLPTSGTTRYLELLHMDLMGPMEVESLGSKKYSFVCVDDFSPFSWQERDQLAKFDSKSDKCLFLGYVTNSRAYRMFNLRTGTIMESINVVFNDCADLRKKTAENEVEDLLENQMPLGNADVVPDVATSGTTCETEVTNSQEDDHSDDEVVNDGSNIPSKIQRNHPSSQIIGHMQEDVQTRKKEKVDYRKMAGLICMSSTYSQINAMYDELEQFVRNDVWNLVPPPDHGNIIGTKWIFKNKTDESGNIIRNKARMVAQGYTQVEGDDFDETFALVARIESVRLLLAIACYMKIELFQMDVKSAFLNGILSEEVYVRQPKGFEDPHHLDHVYKLKKALYVLKQTPRAWYGRLTEYLLEIGFKRGEVDKTLFVQKSKGEILICQVYVDDIIFGSSSQKHANDFFDCMSSTFEMSMVGIIINFLHVQESS